jgi:hypothetical protein
MADNRLFVFVHLAKCAGTSLTHHVKKSFQDQSFLNIFAGPGSYGYYHYNQDEFLQEGPRVCQQISVDVKQKLRYVYGHKMHYRVPQWLEIKKKPFYFTFLRDPAKRVVSLYNYYRGWYERELPAKKDKKIYQNRFLINGESPDFVTWFQEKFLPTKNVFHLSSMTEYFQNLGYLKKGQVDKPTIQNCLDKFSFIGFTDTYESDSLYLFNLWDVNKFFNSRNISTKYFKLNNDDQVHTMVKQELADDYLFYRLAKEWKQDWRNNHPEYDFLVQEMKQKKQGSWWHQWVYDWPANFHFLSSKLRKTVPGYGFVFDRLKQAKFELKKT